MLAKRKVAEAEQNGFPHIDDVSALDDSDIECLREVRDVLKKHGRVERFGVTLLHKHFDLSEDECLVEETDVEQKLQVISVKKKGEVQRERVIETVWRLGDTPNVIMGCERECYISHEGKHLRGHVKRSGG